MPRHFNCSLLRTALIALGAIFIGRDANADYTPTYSGANDPYVQNGINHGEAMSTYSFNRNSLGYALNDAQWTNLSRTVQIVLVPPLPPALGEELPPTNGFGFGGADSDDFAQEIFYGPYLAVHGLDKLSPKETERFAAYRKTRQKLVGEIQLKFEELSVATPVVRATALNQLAAEQEEPLRAFAAEAESIRNDLVRTLSFYGFGTPTSGVTSRDGGGSRDLFNLFAMAYYDDGLSTAQRRLLAEIAHAPPAASAGKSAYFYFLPATARIRLPDNLPLPLQEKINAFTSQKESLKSELRHAVVAESYFFRWQRSHQLAALAVQQAPRFQALEALAEEIRVGLADFEYPGQPAKWELPADLTQRVGKFYARKVEAQRELLNRLRGLRTQFPAAHFDLARQGDGLIIVGTEGAAKDAGGLAEFNASLTRRYAAFASESEVLRRDIQHYTESSPNHTTRTVDQLAADFKRAYTARENWNRYRDYYRAVLVPGLSPAQRQLLFQSAVVGLDQAGPQPRS